MEIMVGMTPEMNFVFSQIRAAAASDDNVLIYGDTGTGKELVAREIHRNSNRASGPFIAVNCSAIPQDLCESELFGHIKGAFSGAFRDKKGKFELAEGGTIFLDEIGTMRPAHQAILLRIIDNRSYERVGCNKTRNVTCRILAASNRNLMKSMEEKIFRSDLYYRLDECYIHVPSLKDRARDIPLLAQYFVNAIAREEKAKTKRISPEAMAMLVRYEWPGNVRELQNAVKKAYRNCTNGTMMVADFAFGSGVKKPRAREGGPEVVFIMADTAGKPDPFRTMDDIEREHIVNVLEAVEGNKLRAAEILGVQRKTLYNKIKKLRLDGLTVQD